MTGENGLEMSLPMNEVLVQGGPSPGALPDAFGRYRVIRTLAFGSPFFAVPAAGASAFMTYKWFMYRAKRGMRF